MLCHYGLKIKKLMTHKLLNDKDKNMHKISERKKRACVIVNQHCHESENKQHFMIINRQAGSGQKFS